MSGEERLLGRRGRRTSHTTTPSKLLTPMRHTQDSTSVLEESTPGSDDVLATPIASTPMQLQRGMRAGTGGSGGDVDEALEVQRVHLEVAVVDLVLSMLLRWEESTFDLRKLRLAGACKHVCAGVSGAHSKPTFILPNHSVDRRWQLTPHFVTAHSFAIYTILNAIAVRVCVCVPVSMSV